MNKDRWNRASRRFLGPLLLVVLPTCVFFAFLVRGQDNPGANPAKTSADDVKKKKKGPGTPVVNAQELPFEMTAETMEVLRISLGVECAYCHVSGEFLERGRNGDRQNDANPRKLIARDMIKMTKEINRALTGFRTFPDPSNVVTCWSCHRGSRRPPTSAATAVPVEPASAAATN